MGPAYGGQAQANSDARCPIDLQLDVCKEANPICPAVSTPVGLADGSWPVFGGNVQHTSVSPFSGPTCKKLIWSRWLQQGTLHASASLAPGIPGEPETLFVPVGRSPLCALNPNTGATYWCNTDKPPKFSDRSAPAIGKDSIIYVGTRDNDMWAIQSPPIGTTSSATVDWQQFVCTDGDISAPPVIDNQGTIFMASDSLGSGAIMAMCPGPVRQPKWCISPLGGGIRNASPALSPSNDELYYLFSGGGLIALDPQTGAEHWRIMIEPKRSVSRVPNHAPVVNPITGRIYVTMRKGLWAVDRPIPPATLPTVTLLFSTETSKLRLDVPPAVDVQHGTIIAAGWKGRLNTLFSLDMQGNVQWSRSNLGLGKFRANNPPAVDAQGNIYIGFGKSLIALNPDGTTMWQANLKRGFDSSPILGDGRVYAGTSDGTVYAFGDCP